MNKHVTNHSEILENAQSILETEGLQALSIRRLAKETNVSIGTLYNYFPDKSALFLELIKDFWHNVFSTSSFEKGDNTNFLSYIEQTYADLMLGLTKFTSGYLQQMSMVSSETKLEGRGMESRFWSHMKKIFLSVLEKDTQVNQNVWTVQFTKEAFIDFVFDSMMSSLKNANDTCDVLLVVINRILY